MNVNLNGWGRQQRVRYIRTMPTMAAVNGAAADLDHLSTPEALLAAAQAGVVELSDGSRAARSAKPFLNQSFELSAEQISAQGRQAQGVCYTSTQHRESVQAVLEKSAIRRSKGEA